MTADSAVTLTVIVALSAHHWLSPALIVIVNNLFKRKKKGHEWPMLKNISAPKSKSNETPTVRGLAAEKNNILYTETMIFL